MDIIDKKNYLGSAFNYIEKFFIRGKIFDKISEKVRIKESILKKFAISLRGLSLKEILVSLNDKIEEVHSSIMGVSAEIGGVDISLQKEREKLFLLLTVKFNIMIDGEKEDETEVYLKIFSKDNIQII